MSVTVHLGGYGDSKDGDGCGDACNRLMAMVIAMMVMIVMVMMVMVMMLILMTLAATGEGAIGKH